MKLYIQSKFRQDRVTDCIPWETWIKTPLKRALTQKQGLFAQVHFPSGRCKSSAFFYPCALLNLFILSESKWLWMCLLSLYFFGWHTFLYLQSGPGCPAPLTRGSFPQIPGGASPLLRPLPRVAPHRRAPVGRPGGAAGRLRQPAAVFPRSYHGREPLASPGPQPAAPEGTAARSRGRGRPLPDEKGMPGGLAGWSGFFGRFCPSSQRCAFPLETISNKIKKIQSGGMRGF